MSDWEGVSLGDTFEVEHGFAFKGEFFDPSGEDVLLTPKNFKAGGGLDVSDARCKRYSGPTDERFVLNPGDIVLAMTDLKQDAPILGSAGVVPAGRRYLHNQRIGKVLVKDVDRLDPLFVPWLMNSPGVREAIRATATGATVRHTAPSRIGAIRTMLPAVGTQRRIAAVLSAFDDLIEINERRIELLENLARSLYREWFMHFRYPGHEDVALVDSDLGPIPKGWRVAPASEVLDVNPRIRPAFDSYRKVVMADVSECFSHVLPSGQAHRASGSKFMRGDVLFARITPCLENGKTALALFLKPDEVGIGSTEFIVLRGVNVGSAFTYCAARSDHLRENAIKSMSGASGRQRVANDFFELLLMSEPPASIASAFEAMAGPMLDSVFQYRVQNEQLAATRDLLLPRFVTGKVDISDIDLGVLTPAEID